MKEKRIIVTVSILLVIIYTGLIVAWHLYAPRENIAVQAPGADNRPAGLARKMDEVVIGEFFMKYEDATSSLTGKWSCFRGERADNSIVTSEKIQTSAADY
ncbi:MAG: hypothetical protein PHX49_09065, partial [Bacteroidales bacterium]|nr:hypothetical protein [Bacteroidales bacterium]